MARNDFRLVRDRFAKDEALPFGRLLSREYVLSVLESEGHKYRNRVFCPLVTLWGWLSQSLSQDKSLNEAVSRILANRVATGLPPCSASSAGYTKARTRFPEAAMTRMAKETGRKVHGSGSSDWNWRGREVFLADGTGFTMSDTKENQSAYPQATTQKPGLGFPAMRAVALISLSTGALVDLAFGKYAGKGTGELGLLQGVAGSLPPGSVLVADRLYPTFATVATLNAQGVDLVSISHRARPVDFSAGEILGAKDHVVEWTRPDSHRRYDYRAADRKLPETVKVREFVIEVEKREGGREEVVIVTSMTDPSISQKEISDLYFARWHCELDIRSIKHSMRIDVLRCKTPEMVRKEIWCHVLAWNLLRGVMTESAKRNDVLPRQLSVKGAMQAVESFTPAMMAIDGNEALYNAFLATVCAHRVGNRPGRLEPRLKKTRPTWREYLKVPRHQTRRRLAAESRRITSLMSGAAK